MKLPILYSFRRCPYAIRARLALLYCQLSVELREVSLKNKPEAMLAISPKGTVPVMQLPSEEVLEENLDIMLWAVSTSASSQLWEFQQEAQQELIKENDNEFNKFLDKYKYPQNPAERLTYQRHSMEYLSKINELLTKNRFLLGDQLTIADLALMPFVRQWARVDWEFFQTLSFKVLQNWLAYHLNSQQFIQGMVKIPLWQQQGNKPYFLCSDTK